MSYREILRQFNQIPKDPQASKAVDFMEAHSKTIRSSNKDIAQLAIAIPAFNEQVLLPRVLATVNQAIQHFDQPVNVLVVDNASTDATPEIANYFGATVIREPIKGIGAARQAGLLATNPENRLILTTDSDSLVGSNWINEHQRVLEDPLVSFSVGGVRLLLDESVSIRKKLGFLLFLTGRSLIQHIKFNSDPLHLPASGANSAYRRDEALAAGGYRPDLPAMEDFDLMVRISETTGLPPTWSRNNPVISSARRVMGMSIRKLARERLAANARILTNQELHPPRNTKIFATIISPDPSRNSYLTNQIPHHARHIFL